MSIPTVPVTVRVHDQDGDPISGAIVTAKLATVERYSGYVVPKEYSGTTDASGIAVVDVFPNELGTEGSEYKFKILDVRTGKSVSVMAVVPNMACELHQIAELGTYELRGAGQIVTAEVAGNAASAAAALASAQSAASDAGTASTKASEAQASADAAAVLPAGGTWAYFLIGIQTGVVQAGVAAGGSTAAPATGGITWNGFVWRIA